MRKEMTSPNIQADQAAFRAAGEQGHDLCLAEKLIMEEVIKELLVNLKKYREAPTLENKALVFDDIVDSVYVLMNLANDLDVPFEAGWQEVHRANMDKFRAGLVKNAAGKVMKPKDWKPPQMWDVLFEYESKKSSEDGTGQLKLF